MNLLVVWKSSNETDINNFIIPYAYNSKVQDWFTKVTVLIWGASQEKVLHDADIQELVRNLTDSGIALYACKMCADRVGATELLESLGVIVQYTGVLLSEAMKDKDTEVITI